MGIMDDLLNAAEQFRNSAPETPPLKELEVSKIPFEESAMGKQLEEMKRIADAATSMAELAKQEAEDAKAESKAARKEASFSKKISIASLIVSIGWLGFSVFSFLWQ